MIIDSIKLYKKKCWSDECFKIQDTFISKICIHAKYNLVNDAQKFNDIIKTLN